MFLSERYTQTEGLLYFVNVINSISKKHMSAFYSKGFRRMKKQSKSVVNNTL